MDLKNATPVLFVKDAPKSRDFYVNVMGMTVVSDFGGMNYAFKEGFAIWQISEGNIIPEKLGRENIEKSQSVSRFEIALETSDLDTVYKKLKENNVKFLHEINTEIWGQRNIRFYDHDGHLIEVGEQLEVFLKRIYEEEGKDIHATSVRTFVPIEMLKNILNP